MQSNLWSSYNGQDLVDENTIYLFKFKVDAYFNKISAAILSSDESDKARRFLNQADRENYVVRKFFLRILLGKVLDTDPRQIVFYREQYKKPSVPDVKFNVSHSKNFAVIALGKLTVGIDIEYINRDFDFNPLLNQCFSDEESVFIKEAKDPHLSFFTLWTKKEALLKATGEGLIDDMQTLSVLPSRIHRNEKEYKLESICTDNFVISICYQASENIKIKLFDSVDVGVFSTF